MMEHGADWLFIGDLNATSQRVARIIVGRLRMGQEMYGDWRVDPPRDMMREALEEGLDLVGCPVRQNAINRARGVLLGVTWCLVPSRQRRGPRRVWVQ